MSERVMTLHPDSTKQGVNIDKGKYDQVSIAVILTIRENPQISFQRLMDEVRKKLNGTFAGSVPWYVTTVKLDLEARGVIRRAGGRGPQRLELVR